MHDQTYEGAGNMAGKINNMAALMQANDTKSDLKSHVLVHRECMRSDTALSLSCVVIQLCLYHA